MPKDYARNCSTRKRTVKQHWRSGWTFLILLLVFASGALYWTATKHGVVFSKQTAVLWVADVKSFFAHKKNKPIKIVSTSSQTHEDANNEVRFDFYTELPSMKVTLPEAEAVQSSLSSSPPPPLSTLPTSAPLHARTANASLAPSYIIQLAEFNEPVSASQFRLSLLLAGVDADVVTIASAGRSIYRVQRGPFASIAAAKAIQQKLQKQGIETSVKKLG